MSEKPLLVIVGDTLLDRDVEGTVATRRTSPIGRVAPAWRPCWPPDTGTRSLWSPRWPTTPVVPGSASC